MASEAPKVRIVRCPKCLKLLPELASVSVYQCGKCGTTLRAKKRKEDQKNKIAETRKPEHEHDSDKESTCSIQKALSCSADGSEQVIVGVVSERNLDSTQNKVPHWILNWFEQVVECKFSFAVACFGFAWR